MTSHAYNWPAIKAFIDDRVDDCRPVHTSLLGRVLYRENEHGEYESIIPDALQREANSLGLTIISADFRSNQYTIKRGRA